MNVLVDEDTGDPADLTYEWTCDEQAGAITAGGSATDTTLTYRANFLASAQTETVTAEAFLPDDHGALESVGAATATLTIAPPTIEIDPVIVTLAPDQSATLTASVTPEPDTTLDGIVTYTWTCTNSHGTLVASNDTATYTAGTSSTGTDEVEANVTLSPPTGAAFALGFAGVDVVVDAGTPGVPFALEILGKPSQTLPDGSVVDVRVPRHRRRRRSGRKCRDRLRCDRGRPPERHIRHKRQRRRGDGAVDQRFGRQCDRNGFSKPGR